MVIVRVIRCYRELAPCFYGFPEITETVGIDTFFLLRSIMKKMYDRMIQSLRNCLKITYDKTTLVQYPSCRMWPYYNVAESATSIASQAFSGCDKLVNLYIPNSMTMVNGSAIKDCPNLTVCCYMNSTAYRYALDNSLTAWYMDNKKLQCISIYSLPEQKFQVEGQVDLQGLYVVGNYQGKELQIDDYTLSYDQKTSGVKTVTVEYQGKTVTFEMVLYKSSEGNLISFRCEEDLNGKVVMIAVYDRDGKMLYTGNATISDGEALVGVSDSVYQNADNARLFILDAETFGPVAAVQEQSIEDAGSKFMMT